MLREIVKGKNIYGRGQVKIPTPKFAVFYNGEEEQPEQYDLKDAIGAIDRCIREDVLKDFLMDHRSEVVRVTELDYTFDRQLMLERRDSREEGFNEGREEGYNEGRTEGLRDGREEGVAKGRAEGIISMGREFGLSDEEIAGRLMQKLGINADRANKYLEMYK